MEIYLAWIGLGLGLAIVGIFFCVVFEEKFWGILIFIGILITFATGVAYIASINRQTKRQVSPCVRMLQADSDILKQYTMQLQPDGSCSFTRRGQE